MEDSRGNSIREAIKKYGPITDRFILRLGKSEEEAGKFESWHSTPSTFAEDFQGYLACLHLTRLVDSVEERMKAQKGSIRAIKKEQKATAKAIAKEQEKLQKALDKAAAKLVKDAEKAKAKEEAKAERERLKAEKKAGKPCTSSESTQTQTETSLTLATILPQDENGCLSGSSTVKIAPELVEVTQENLCTTSMVETETMVLPTGAAKVFVEAITNPPEPNAALKYAALQYEEEVTPSSYKLPME